MRCLSLVLVVALVAVTMQPTPAEALEPTTILLIAGAGVAVIALIAILIIANVSEKRPRTAQVVTSMVALPSTRASRASCTGLWIRRPARSCRSIACSTTAARAIESRRWAASSPASAARCCGSSSRRSGAEPLEPRHRRNHLRTHQLDRAHRRGVVHARFLSLQEQVADAELASHEREALGDLV